MSEAPTHDGSAVAPSWAVVVHCQVGSGADAHFDTWVSKLGSSAISAPGFSGVQIVSTTVKDQGRDWAVTYRFSEREDRDTWMDSDAYRDALVESPDIFVMPPVEERIDHGERPKATEAVISVVPPDRVEEYVAARDEIDRAVAQFPGFVKVEHHPPQDAARDRTWTTLIVFESGEDLMRWRDSPERSRGVNRIRKIAPDVDKVLPSGFGRWFAVDATATRSTPAWKQAMVVLAVLYGMVSLLNMTIGDYIGTGISVRGDTWVTGLGAPLPIIVFVENLVGTALLTWVLMPVITRLMKWWLRPDVSRARTIQGTVLMIVIYAVEIAVFVAVFESYRF